jgi:sirohydrochlorin cobaltochelatase
MGFVRKPEAALVLLGHGSTQNPESSAPTWRHADELRRRGVFGEVVCGFWKEEPGWREVLNMVDAPLVYLVPNFISEGYFTREVLPRELGIAGPVTRRGSRTLCYCDPVGVHPSMGRLLLRRAAEVAPGVARERTALMIVGHGTTLNENSRVAVRRQVDRLRGADTGFAEVTDAYMEEDPLVARWDEWVSAPNVVVVPFFISDGLHSFDDIPVLLGLPPRGASDAAAGAGHELRGRRLFYSTAIGTDPMMADVILDQVTEFDQAHFETAAR